MDWSNLFEKNFTAILVLIGSLSSVILGQLLLKKHELKYRQSDWRKEYRVKYLIEPLINYIDEILEMMYKVMLVAGPKFSQQQKPDVMDFVEMQLQKYSVILSRIEALGDSELEKEFTKFKEYFTNYMDFFYKHEKNKASMQDIRKATEIGSLIIRRLKP